MFENLTNQFENLESDKNYWFIRTMKGRNFAPFLNNSFIGINWNYVTATNLRELNEREIKNIIAANERDSRGNLYDPVSTRGKTKITSIYNKLIRFKELKAGDMVVIPSSSSNLLAFGVITDDEIFNNFDDDVCDFHKRRHVHWITSKHLEELDSIFYKMIFSLHAISNINSYSSYIDKIVSSVFVKDDKSHLILNVRQEGDINYDSLNGVLQNVRSLTELINDSFHFQEDLSNNSVKLNIQSPGTIEFIYNTGRSLLLASIFLTMPLLTSCSNTSSAQDIIDEKNENVQIVIDTIDRDDRFSPAEKDTLKDFGTIHIDTIAMTKKNMKEIDSIVSNN
ncbi:hypothetical protein LPB87_14415 [Flavobacterium sp. EDS]|uniref:hypothetical protein n=1 Tax=Flavobacterium sp. EDS TaxID=2897328 RepID=UPI001E2C5F0A|nr:hypothetical protein [Flavobacterium sp. EDS]MCD0475590.1 hypothetical protein [Flavobacterium sp. EDS]